MAELTENMSLYLGSRIPRFLTEANTASGAKHLIQVLALRNAADLPEYLSKAFGSLLGALRQMGLLGVLFWNFDFSKIPADVEASGAKKLIVRL